MEDGEQRMGNGEWGMMMMVPCRKKEMVALNIHLTLSISPFPLASPSRFVGAIIARSVAACFAVRRSEGPNRSFTSP